VVGPHGAYALPGRMMISGAVQQGRHRQTALVEYSNEGDYIATHWMPTAKDPRGAANGEKADGYGYDVRVLPRRNVMLTSSFTGTMNYMRPLGEVAGDPRR
jgi:methanethiol oxidase